MSARSVKALGCVMLIIGWTHAGRCFSLLGPFDTWQTTDMTYQVGPGIDIGGPQNLGEEFRFSAPTVFYAFESSFLDYFGSNGVADVQKAIKTLNDIPAYSRLSQQLTEYPLQSQRINYQAQALFLLDLKSYALHALLEQMGLAEPERYTWTLRARFIPPGAMCPRVNYAVVHRNFDPVTFEPTAYVNGTLYSYQIVETCLAPYEADAIEFQVDPLAFTYTSVAGLNTLIGGFFTGLTRDDIGGLRYMYRKSNYNTEPVPNDATVGGGSTIVIGNTDSPWTPVFGTNNLPTNVVPPTATSSNIALRAGVDKVTFVRADFDSVLGSFFVPFTNSYTSSTLVNGRSRSERVFRGVVHPDIVFAAADLGVFNPPATPVTFARTFPPAYQRSATTALNGPGTLPLGVAAPTFLTFSKIGTVRVNQGPFFIDEASAFVDFTWASFDGSTNTPVLYPSGRSIMDLEAEILRP